MAEKTGKRVLIAGASGMIGSLILEKALKCDEVARVVCLVRRSLNVLHPKLTEVIVNDFMAYSTELEVFKEVDVAYFCIGVYTANVSDEVLKTVTVDYSVGFAKVLKEHSPKAVFCLLSGEGADRTGKSIIAFARYKGIAEAEISKLGLEFYTFRPGYIYPVKPRKEPNVWYKIWRLMYPFIRLAGPKYSVKSTELAEAMFCIGLNGYPKEIVENIECVKFMDK